MQPEKPSVDGISKPAKAPRGPEYRPDHELEAPAPQPKLTSGILEEVAPIGDMAPEPRPKPRSKRKIIIIIAAAILSVALIAALSAYAWYQQQLSPVSNDATKRVRVTIESGSSPTMIGTKLKESGVIRDKTAFGIYAKLSSTENKLKAGTYNLQPSQSTPQIVEHLVAGKEDTFNVTFLPGDTLANSRQKLIALGYSASDVDTALGKVYEGLLFTAKPVEADLEGYLYGETITFDSSATVEQILVRFFNEFESVIKQNDLVTAYQKQGLSLFEGITLASIVQRESQGDPEDQRQIARVFLNRMKAGMTLGSDVTYQYAAKKLGVAPDPSLDSPYNTRIHTGLPPGPIATPGKNALLSIANPGQNDYLFFLSGDDDVTYFAKNDAEHQRNISNYCQKKCLIN